MRPEIAWEHEVAHLVAIREAQGITQLDLAELLECSPNGVHEWETGKRQPRISAWLAWRRALGLSYPWSMDSARRDLWRARIKRRRRG